MEKHDIKSGIRVRRFAGHALHAAQLDRRVRVAHLTDLHVGRITPTSVLERAVELTNAAKPDLIAITGDFVCHSQSYLDLMEYVISGLEAPVFAVLGNHDHWSGAEEVRLALGRAGAEVLENVNTIITIGRQRIQIAGVADSYSGCADVQSTLRGLRADLPVLGLSHIAEEADAMWHGGVPLVLSGHTHGGQITVGGLHEIAMRRLGGHRYVHGLYGQRRHDEGTTGAVYVGAGIGASVMPLRVGDRGAREIALFDLGSDPSSFDEHHDEQLPLVCKPVSERARDRRILKVYRKEMRRQRGAGQLRGLFSGW